MARDGSVLFAHAIEPRRVLNNRSVGMDGAAVDAALPQALRGLAGTDAAMQSMLLKTARLATREMPVLLQGETGSGKEYLARAIHTASGRRGNFVAVNCAALPESLIESELFGYLAGTYTGGAARGRTGLIEAADGGLGHLVSGGHEGAGVVAGGERPPAHEPGQRPPLFATDVGVVGGRGRDDAREGDRHLRRFAHRDDRLLRRRRGRRPARKARGGLFSDAAAATQVVEPDLAGRVAAVPGEQARLLERVAAAERNLQLLAAAGRDVSDYQEAHRRYEGLLLWQASEDFTGRVWEARKQLEQLDQQLQALEGARIRVERAVNRAEDLDPYRERISSSQQRLEYQANAIESAIARIRQELRKDIVVVLEAQQDRLRYYLAHARMAVARLYDSARVGEP